MDTALPSLAQWLIQERERRGWTQAMLADRAGLKRNEMNAIEKGRVTLPGADKRRKLADALGVRHLDILVAAGELTGDEIPVEGAPRPLFPEDDVRSRIVAMLRAIDPNRYPNDAYLESLLPMINRWIVDQRKGKGAGDDDE